MNLPVVTKNKIYVTTLLQNVVTLFGYKQHKADIVHLSMTIGKRERVNSIASGAAEFFVKSEDKEGIKTAEDSYRHCGMCSK